MANDGSTLIKAYRKEGIRRVKLAFTDIDGVMRGKYISLDKFASIADGTSGFCDCVLGWDVNDQLYDNAEFTGWHTAFPDAKYRLDLDSEIRLQEEANTPFFIADFVVEDQLHPICPRSRLKEVIHRAHKLGYAAKMAFEYEFFIFLYSFVIKTCQLFLPSKEKTPIVKHCFPGSRMEPMVDCF